MSSEIVQLSRSLKNQGELYNFYGKPSPTTKPLKQTIKDNCTANNVTSYLMALFPFVKVIRTYNIRQFILDDVFSGVSAACLHFPQGLAFGILSSLAPAYGLYTSFFPVIFYALFGTSPHISFGTNAVIAVFTSELVEQKIESLRSPMYYLVNASLDNNFTTILSEVGLDELKYKASVAAGSSFLVGVILLLMGLCRLGFITSYLSSSFIVAFTTTGGVHILSSQVPNALGITVPATNKPGKLIYMFIEIFKRFPEIHVATLIVSIICFIILVVVKDVINEKCKHRMKIPIPIDVILVVLATIISTFAKLNKQYGIGVVGTVPSCLPTPEVPRVSADIIGHSFVVAIIIFVLTISMARLCEVKHDYSVDDNQELVAYGAANFISSFFSCFPACVAPPRTILLSITGAKTTLNGLVSAVLILLIILFIGQYLGQVPKAVLAVMIICAVKSLLCQVCELPKLWRTNRYDFVIFLGTVLSGVLIDFPYALYAGVILCLFTVIIQSQNASTYTIGKLEQEDRMLDLDRYNLPGNNTTKVAVFRMESSLYFATADKFRKDLYKQTLNPKAFRRQRNRFKGDSVEIDINYEGDNDTNDKMSLSNVDIDIESSMTSLTHIIIDCSSINYIDMNGAQMLKLITYDFKQIGVKVLFGNCTNYMINFIAKPYLKEYIDSNDVYNDILDAYLAVTNSH